MAKKAQILVEAVDMTQAALGSVERNLKSVNEASNLVARSFQAVLAATGAIEFGRQMIGNAMQAEQASNRLQAVLRATGNAAGFVKGELDDMADALAGATQFDDESIRGAQATLLKFGNITGSVFKEGLQLATDYAAFMGTDVADAAQIVGKALSSPTEGMAALERQIGKLRPEQEAMINNLVTQGRTIEAQNAVLDILRSKIGGTAEIMNTGLTGATTGAKKAWDELMESLGKTDAIGGTAQRALNGISALFLDIRDYITEADSRLDRFLKNAAAARAFAPDGPAIGPDGNIIGGGRFGRRGKGTGATAAPGPVDTYENSFDTGAMRRALLPAPVLGGNAKKAEKSDFDRALESLTREAAGAAAATKLQQVVGEIEAGVYGKLTAVQATRLKQLAEEIDLGRKNKELAQDIDRFQKNAMKDYEQQAEKAMRAVGTEAARRKEIRDSIIDTIDPSRKLYEEQAKIDQALADGIITDEQADNALAALGARFNELTMIMSKTKAEGKTMAEELADAMAQWGKGFSRQMAEMALGAKFSFDGIKTSFRGLLADIVAMQIDKRITQKVVSAGSGALGDVLDKVFGSSSSGASASTSSGIVAGDFNIMDSIGSIFSGLGAKLGFATGGSFTVGGAGGTDSQLVNFMATPGERVTVETPAQQRSGGGGLVVHQTLQIGGNVSREDIPAIMEGARRGAVAAIVDMKNRGEL